MKEFFRFKNSFSENSPRRIREIPITFERKLKRAHERRKESLSNCTKRARNTQTWHQGVQRNINHRQSRRIASWSHDWHALTAIIMPTCLAWLIRWISHLWLSFCLRFFSSSFGIYHDTAKTGCDKRSGPILHIMTPSFEADTAQVSWSNCSRRDITQFLE